VAAGVAGSEIAILVRTNAQLAPIEAALTRAGLAYRVRGAGFYRRTEVRAGIDMIRSVGPEIVGPGLALAVRALFAEGLGHEEGVAPDGDEARERAASLDTILGIVDDLVAVDPAIDGSGAVAELVRRAAAERAGTTDGVELATYHRAKGLEWDAVFLPMLEEGTLPIRQASDDDEALEEERRLLYVGITRARTHLALSWAEQRVARGRDTRRQPSRFLAGLDGRPAGRDGGGARRDRVVRLPDGFAAPKPRPRDGDSPLLSALREWRAGRAREDAVPAYVVAHDTTLAAIAEARPGSAAALRRVRGMGPAKLERYGAEILAVVESAVGD
jgi:DNA helicase-2/ATP-dependent DNA helicase PcrA